MRLRLTIGTSFQEFLVCKADVPQSRLVTGGWLRVEEGSERDEEGF